MVNGELAYFKPDKTWQSWGWQTYEDYQEKMVIPGRFHDGVPEDIKEDYKTVEYLMAHAFYHYRMYDDALNHLLGTFEMAVKFRAKELEILMERPRNNKGKVYKKTLGELIEEVSKTEWTENWRKFMDRVRDLRNHMKHPESHSLMGYFAKQHIIPILNFINKLFLTSEQKASYHDELIRINELLGAYKNELFVIPKDENANYLGYSPRVTDCFQKNGEWYYLLHFLPVLIDVQDMISNHRYGGIAPHLYLSKISTSKEGVKNVRLVDFERDLDLIIENMKEENKKVYQNYIDVLKTQDTGIIERLNVGLYTELYKNREDLLYKFAWK